MGAYDQERYAKEVEERKQLMARIAQAATDAGHNADLAGYSASITAACRTMRVEAHREMSGFRPVFNGKIIVSVEGTYCGNGRLRTQTFSRRPEGWNDAAVAKVVAFIEKRAAEITSLRAQADAALAHQQELLRRQAVLVETIRAELGPVIGSPSGDGSKWCVTFDIPADSAVEALRSLREQGFIA